MNMATCIKDEMRDLDRYADALRHIPADDREIWIRIGMALHFESGGGPAGLDLWEHWSQSSVKYDPLELRRQWRSFKANSHGVTGGTVISLAREHGYASAHDHNCKFSVPIHPESEVLQNSTTAGRAIGYTYIDADGQIYGKKIRYEPKAFAWDKDKKAGRCPPYGLPRLLEHPDEPVFVVEGEKDADRLNKEGLVAISIEQGHESSRRDLPRRAHRLHSSRQRRHGPETGTKGAQRHKERGGFGADRDPSWFTRQG